MNIKSTLGALLATIAVSVTAMGLRLAEPTGCVGFVVTPPSGPTYLACEDPCEGEICFVQSFTLTVGPNTYPAYRCTCFESGGTRCCQVVGLKEPDGSVTPKAVGQCSNAQSFCPSGNLCDLDEPEPWGKDVEQRAKCFTAGAG